MRQHQASYVRNLLLACCSWYVLTVSGQTIYRCGSSYGDTPCAGASTLSIDDSRSAAQKAQTDAATVQTRKLALQLERERLMLEKSVSSTRPAPGAQTRDNGDKAAGRPGGTAGANMAKSKANKKSEGVEILTAVTVPAKKDKAAKAAKN